MDPTLQREILSLFLCDGPRNCCTNCSRILVLLLSWEECKNKEMFLLSAALAGCISMGSSVTCDLLPIFVLLCVIFVIFAVTVSSIKQYSYKKMLRGYRSAMGAAVSFSSFYFP